MFANCGGEPGENGLDVPGGGGAGVSKPAEPDAVLAETGPQLVIGPMLQAEALASASEKASPKPDEAEPDCGPPGGIGGCGGVMPFVSSVSIPCARSVYYS